MNKGILLVLVIGIVACQSTTQENQAVITQKEPDSALQWSRDKESAVTFLEDYSRLLSSDNQEPEVFVKWINEHYLLTDAFKKSYQTLLDSAWQAAPDYGLGADPIFDAQDFPSDFHISADDSLQQMVTIGSSSWPDFSLKMYMAPADQHYLIDGVGIVNIPSATK